VFFKVSGKPQVIEDRVRGRVERTEEKDFVIYRSDGSPVFHFVNVVDDMTMGITHVIRGEDHLSNTSKHTELFAAFGVKPPEFAHIPLILKQSGPGKMSKRDKGALVEEYEQKGFLPASVRNYLCLLGWSPKDDREVMTIDEILSEFDFKGIQKGSAKFDERKMAFINTEHLRHLPLESFCWLVSPLLTEDGIVTSDTEEDYLHKVMALVQPKVQSLESIVDYVRYFFSDDYSEDGKAWAKLQKKADPITKISEARDAVSELRNWTEESLNEAFLKLASDHGQEKPFPWLPSIRWAVSATAGGPDLIPLLVVLGKDKVIARFDRIIE